MGGGGGGGDIYKNAKLRVAKWCWNAFTFFSVVKIYLASCS